MPKIAAKSGKPAVGDVVGRSVAKAFGYILFLIFMFGFGLLLVWSWWTGGSFLLGGGEKQATWWGLILGAAMSISAPVLAVQAIHRIFVRERLVLASDRLQVIRRAKGADIAILQIPYDNIKTANFVTTQSERLLVIDLQDLEDPNTFGCDFAANKSGEDECHFAIRGGWKLGVSELHRMLKRAMEKDAPSI